MDGYEGKQVRDAIHSRDLIGAFHEVSETPRVAAVYNIGGGRTSNCSVVEAIAAAERISGNEMSWSYTGQARTGDHIWWVGDNGRFESHYPGWRLAYDVERILQEIHDENLGRWHP